MNDFLKEIQERLELALPRIANRIQTELILACPVDTGRLRNSIKVKSTSQGIIIWMVDYGKFVEFGTPPHIIEPHNKKALAFEVGKIERLSGKKKGKTMVVVKKVRHPGTRPNPFVRNTIQTKLRKIIQEEIMNNNV
jgi:hypothetical protein